MTGSPQLRRSACPLDCPDACSLEVTVEAGRVVKLAGASDRNPLTAGFICSKVRDYPAHLYGPQRLLRPLRRVGAKGEGRFAPIGWDEALDLAAERLRTARERDGGESILPYSYGGSNGLLSQDTIDALLFRRLGASRLARTVCAAATGRAALGLYGKMEGVALTDYAHARLIVIWGCNPSASGIHLVPIVRAARRIGARLVVVDPRRIPLAAEADLHLAPRPGTDVAVALSLLRELFASGRSDLAFLSAHATGVEALQERAAPWTFARAAEIAGVPAADLARFAELYAETSPAVIRCGWGLERNRNGGSAVAAVLALPAVAGKFGVRGGGYTLSNSAAWSFDGSAVAGPEPATRLINMNRLGEALSPAAVPPVRVLFVYNSNALMTTPHQTAVRRGLERDDLFTVVFDQVATDTSRYADLVLPATTFLEHHELSRGYGAFVLQASDPVIPPVGESRSNHDVFVELAVRTGVAKRAELPDVGEVRRRVLASSGRGDELTAAIVDHGYATPAAGDRPIQFVDVFPHTPDRKIHLVPEALDREAPSGLYAYRPDPGDATHPLALISPATGKTISSTFGQLRREPARLEIHPDDAAARGLADGDRVRVTNGLGEVHCRARLSAAVRRGVVVLPKGLWSHQTENGATACALAPDTLADLGGSACFNDARVEVERLSG